MQFPSAGNTFHKHDIHETTITVFVAIYATFEKHNVEQLLPAPIMGLLAVVLNDLIKGNRNGRAETGNISVVCVTAHSWALSTLQKQSVTSGHVFTGVKLAVLCASTAILLGALETSPSGGQTGQQIFWRIVADVFSFDMICLAFDVASTNPTFFSSRTHHDVFV